MHKRKPEERRQDLRALHRLLVENRDALVDAVNQDFGCRSRFETLMTELLQAQEGLLDAIKRLPRWMRRRRSRISAPAGASRATASPSRWI